MKKFIILNLISLVAVVGLGTLMLREAARSTATLRASSNCPAPIPDAPMRSTMARAAGVDEGSASALAVATARSASAGSVAAISAACSNAR